MEPGPLPAPAAASKAPPPDCEEQEDDQDTEEPPQEGPFGLKAIIDLRVTQNSGTSRCRDSTWPCPITGGTIILACPFPCHILIHPRIVSYRTINANHPLFPTVRAGLRIFVPVAWPRPGFCHLGARGVPAPSPRASLPRRAGKTRGPLPQLPGQLCLTAARGPTATRPRARTGAAGTLIALDTMNKGNVQQDEQCLGSNTLFSLLFLFRGGV